MGSGRDKRRKKNRVDQSAKPPKLARDPTSEADRWKGRIAFTHRNQTEVAFTNVGVRVKATNPDEMNEAIEKIVIASSKDEPEN
jgi:hypothetical protein